MATLLGVLALSAAPAGAKTGYDNLCPSWKRAFCTRGYPQRLWRGGRQLERILSGRCVGWRLRRKLLERRRGGSAS